MLNIKVLKKYKFNRSHTRQHIYNNYNIYSTRLDVNTFYRCLL